MLCLKIILTLISLNVFVSVKADGETAVVFQKLFGHCGNNLTNVERNLLTFAAQVCSGYLNNNYVNECQTDCKFLLRQLNRKCSFKSETNISTSCLSLARNNETTNGVSQIWHQFCVTDDWERLPAGFISRKPCSEIVGLNFKGDAILFCSISGNVITDTELCRFNEELFKSVQRVGQLLHPTKRIYISYDTQDVSEFVANVNKNIDLVEKFGNVLQSTGVSALVNLVSSIGSFLGPIGAVFSFLGALFPGGNKEHQELLNRLDRLEVKINEVSSKIDDLTIHVSNAVFMSEFRQNTMKLVNVEHDIRRFVNNPSELTKSLLVSRCMDNPASELVQWFLQIVQTLDNFSFANMFSFDRTQYNNKFGKPALAYIIRAISAQIKCVGVLKGTQEDIETFAKDLQTMSQTVASSISYTYNNYIPDYAIQQTLERDVIDMLRRFEGQSNSYVSEQMFRELERKYDFFSWGVNVYDAVTGTDHHIMKTSCFKCVGRQYSGSFWVYRTYGRCVNVMYTNTRHNVNSFTLTLLGFAAPSLEAKLNQLFAISGVRNALVVKPATNFYWYGYPVYMYFREIRNFGRFSFTF